jgi:apolipoprotein N-acyltransferase
MNKYTLAALSVIAGILSGLAWTSWCSGLILLVSFVPFFLIENYLFRNPKRFSPNAYFIYILPGFVIFSIITMGWMRVASMTGAICVIMGLSFLMAFVSWLAHIVRLRKGNTWGIIAMITFWLTYEYASLNINIVSPWINLGNGLSKDILFTQWYEITGTGGGSLWILVSNICLTIFLINSMSGKKQSTHYLLIWLLVVLVPATLSIYRYKTITSNNNNSEVVIVQPNTDPYTEKFTIPFEEQLNKVIELAAKEISAKTEWIITPETTIDDPANLDNLQNDKYINTIKELARHNPHLNLVTGMVTSRLYPPMKDPPTVSARKIDASGLFYDHFNSAVQIDTGNVFGIYHKSKLVPGIEMQFSTGPGRLLTKILPDLGGTNWGYGMQDERTVFTHTSSGMKIAPVICYESVFGKFVTEYIKKGAQAIFIITNDGWWKNTNGYQQHLSFASLRAIETRRMVARSANTGISCIIDIRGKRTIESGWWQKSVLKGEIAPETRITTYVKYGDYILWIAAILSGIIFIIIFIAGPIKKKLSH